MSDQGGDTISATISGGVGSGAQVGVGKGITQTQTIGPPPPQTNAELRKALEDLRAQVSTGADVPEDKRDRAASKLDDLEEALEAPAENVSTLEAVKDWFAKHAPKLVGAVTSVVVNPVVGALVATAGDAVKSEYDRRFGGKG
jgi:hypothetical protein